MKGIKLLMIIVFSICFMWTTTAQFLIENGAKVDIRNSAYLVLDNVDFINRGDLTENASTEYMFIGNTDQHIDFAGETIPTLNINKTIDGRVYLDGEVTISTELKFGSAPNRIILGDHSMTLFTNTTIAGADEDHFIVTDGLGQLEKSTPQNFTYPVGATTSTYNPITITYDGPFDRIRVKVLEHVLTSGTMGSILTNDVVDASWEVSEMTPGGSELDITLHWNLADQLPGFDDTDCGIAQHDSGTDWDLSPSEMQNPSGTSLSLTDVQPGVFAVSDDLFMDHLPLRLKAFLQGPYNIGTGLMNDQIRAADNLPTNSPYTTGKFNPAGRGGGEIASVSAFSSNGDDSVVDWVMVWLRDAINPSTILQTKAALLQKDGDIVDLDGVSDLEIPGDDGSYIIDVGHRNHLSIRTINAISMNEAAPTTYDFSTAQSQAFGTNPMADLGGGVYGLYGGNASGNNNVRATGPPFLNDYTNLLLFLGSPTNIISGQYVDEDINMDGTVRVTGPPFINDYSKLLNTLGNPTTIISEQF